MARRISLRRRRRSLAYILRRGGGVTAGVWGGGAPGGVRGIRPPSDPWGRGLVVWRVRRDGRVPAVVVRVHEAVLDHLAVLVGHLLVGVPLDALDGILVNLLGAHLHLLARRLAEDLGVEYALVVDPLADHYVAVGGVLEPHVLGTPAVLPEPHRRVEAGLYVRKRGVVWVALHDLQPRVVGRHVYRGGDLAEPAAVGDADATVGVGLGLFVLERPGVIEE